MEMNAVPPSGVNYTDIIPLAMSAKATTRKFRPQTTNTFLYSSGQRTIRIPLTSSGFLDPMHSFLRFKIRGITTPASTAANTQKLRLDGSASCWINRLRVEGSDGSELERIESYNVLAAMLDTIVVNHDTSAGLDSVMSGKNVPYYGSAVANFPNYGAFIPTSGGPSASPGSDNAGVRASYVVRLASAMFNTDKFIPVGFISGAGLTLELQLEDPRTAFVVQEPGQVIDYEISDIEFVGHVMEFSTEFEQAFGASLMQRGPVYFHGTTYRNYVYTVTNSTQFSIPVAERCRSLKALLVAIRDNADTSSQTAYSVSRRTGHNLKQYQFKIGSVVYPQQPVNFDDETNVAPFFIPNRSEAFAETLKAFAGLSDLRIAPNVYGTTTNSDPAAANSFQDWWNDPQFILAVDLEKFPGDTGRKESGLNTAAQALQIEIDIRANGTGLIKKATAGTAPNIVPDATATTRASISTVRFDTYSMIDVMFRVDASGTVSVIY